MILAALLLAAAAPSPATAEDAERAFAAMAQRDGQWTAFRSFAAADAIMFAPDPVNAQAHLKGRKNPLMPVMWWPSTAMASCDRSLAISTGPWRRDGGKAHGSFTTVWQRQPGGDHKWLLDHGRDTPRPLAAGEKAKRRDASCRNLAARKNEIHGFAVAGPVRLSTLTANAAPDLIVQEDGRMPASKPAADLTLELGDSIAGGSSADRSLIWDVQTIVGGAKGAHILTVRRWDGEDWRLALLEITGAPQP
ncbi:hypothetical protein SAMN06295912_11029 [Sphingomonas laterariae]|uniref:DUF4440 domain-containing protein n=1 Tax=Edaphosphingomonas laterariae TaxID=861865 RepID=A0A239FTC7_9SPHN|nr:hypothetical protein [Sphingomonas laterariae]SNS60045.1 hypothetical protein SAMN06295912_11029 [Sphingomonas laterariae]